MLRRGEEELDIDLERSFVVGDRMADVQVGKAVGATTILVLTGYGRTTLGECRAAGVQPDLTAPSIVEAVDFILQRIQRTHESTS
jgi:histidinol phosphatase-like enzyme